MQWAVRRSRRGGCKNLRGHGLGVGGDACDWLRAHDHDHPLCVDASPPSLSDKDRTAIELHRVNINLSVQLLQEALRQQQRDRE